MIELHFHSKYLLIFPSQDNIQILQISSKRLRFRSKARIEGQKRRNHLVEKLLKRVLKSKNNGSVESKSLCTEPLQVSKSGLTSELEKSPGFRPNSEGYAVKSSKRSDGSWRHPRKVKPGYIPI